MFHSWLLPHRATLRTLDLGYLSRGSSEKPFKACDFPVLESLELSRWQMNMDLPCRAEDAAAILGPNLRYFGWSFSIYDQHSESWDDFKSRERDWLRNLLNHAKETNSRLARLFVRFRPDEWSISLSSIYPWDLMDKLNDEFQPFGMTVKYSKPLMTKDEWMVLVEKLDQNAEDGAWLYDGQSKSDKLESTDSELSEEETSDTEFVYPKLDDPNPGRDIRTFFPLVQALQGLTI